MRGLSKRQYAGRVWLSCGKIIQQPKATGRLVLHATGRSTRSASMKQLTAPQLVMAPTKGGFQRLEWSKLRERNEALDCRVYARAAAWIVGADRWPESRWADLEAQLGLATTPEEAGESETSPTAGSVRRVRRVAKRRTLRSSFMR